MAGQHDICSMPIGRSDANTIKNVDKCHLPYGREQSKEVQAHPCLKPRQDPCAPAHNEYICHIMGEKRQHYLNEVEKLLDKMDTTECPRKSTIEGPHGTAGKSKQEKPMMKYPGYVDMESLKFREPFYVPLITSVPVKELRPTNQLSMHKDENSPTLQYIDVDDPSVRPCNPWALPRQKSFELKSSLMLRGCDCHKHNGLQDRCERSECNGSPGCLTQPSPSCPPSFGLAGPPPQRPVNDMVREVVSGRGPSNKTFCCCPAKKKPKFKTIDGKRFPDCNHAGGPGSFVCYKCRQ